MYGSAETVILRTGAKPKDYGLADDAALENMIEDMLVEASAIINTSKGRDYEAEFTAGDIDAIPDLCNSIANLIVANGLNVIIARRTSPVVRINDFNVRLTDDKVITAEVKARLALLPGRPSTGFRLGIARVPGRSEPDPTDPETWE